MSAPLQQSFTVVANLTDSMSIVSGSVASVAIILLESTLSCCSVMTGSLALSFFYTLFCTHAIHLVCIRLIPYAGKQLSALTLIDRKVGTHAVSSAAAVSLYQAFAFGMCSFAFSLSPLACANVSVASLPPLFLPFASTSKVQRKVPLSLSPTHRPLPLAVRVFLPGRPFSLRSVSIDLHVILSIDIIRRSHSVWWYLHSPLLSVPYSASRLLVPSSGYSLKWTLLAYFAAVQTIDQPTKQHVGLCPGDEPRFGCHAENSLPSTGNFELSQLTQCPLIDLQLLVANGKLIAPHCFMLYFTFLLTWEVALVEAERATVVVAAVAAPFGQLAIRSGRM